MRNVGKDGLFALVVWTIVVASLLATVLTPARVDLGWLSMLAGVGWLTSRLVARKHPKAAAFQEAFSVAFLQLTLREIFQHRWLG